MTLADRRLTCSNFFQHLSSPCNYFFHKLYQDDIFLRKKLPSKKYDPLVLIDSLQVLHIAATKKATNLYAFPVGLSHLFSLPHGTLSDDFS